MQLQIEKGRWIFVCLNNNGLAFRKYKETKHPLCCEVVEMLDLQKETAPTFATYSLFWKDI